MSASPVSVSYQVASPGQGGSSAVCARAFSLSRTRLRQSLRRRTVPSAHKVEIEALDGKVSVLEVPEGDSILDAALNKGLELSHDCRMGVCMTCPAKLVSGEVDQSAGMLDEEAREKGYALLCVAQPQSDCRLRIITEDELLEQVLCSSTNVA